LTPTKSTCSRSTFTADAARRPALARAGRGRRRARGVAVGSESSRLGVQTPGADEVLPGVRDKSTDRGIHQDCRLRQGVAEHREGDSAQPRGLLPRRLGRQMSALLGPTPGIWECQIREETAMTGLARVSREAASLSARVRRSDAGGLRAARPVRSARG
jgi:hypothetical protein